jgi:hypothetical protein
LKTNQTQQQQQQQQQHRTQLKHKQTTTNKTKQSLESEVPGESLSALSQDRATSQI